MAGIASRAGKAPFVSCQSCKSRHLKCDNDHSICASCKRLGVECVRGDAVRFRHDHDPSYPRKSGLSFHHYQQWPKITGQLRFVNESDHVTLTGKPGASTDHEAVESDASFQNTMLGPGRDTPYQTSSSPVADQPFLPPLTIDGPHSTVIEHAAVINTPINRSPSQHQDSPLWAVRNAQEAMLFSYFHHDLAPRFDLCDAQRHFSRVVTCRAASCLPLLTAMFAASAKHLSRISDFSGLVADRYHQKCLDVLIPSLSEPSATMDDNLLAAVVILRFVEELDVPPSPSATRPHVIGTRIFIAAQGNLFNLSALWRAGFWVAMRQEIYISLMQGRPVHPNFELSNVQKPIQADLDDHGCSFANQLVVHVAFCTRICYGGPFQDISAWTNLRQEHYRLWNERPWLFRPIYRDPLATPFPVEVYVNEAVVIGVQHSYLAEILIVAYDPTGPKLGPEHGMIAKERETRIKRLVHQICGVAESNPQTSAAYTYACVSVILAGDRFKDRREQETLYQLLRKTDEQLAWPTKSVQNQMKKAWGWLCEENH